VKEQRVKGRLPQSRRMEAVSSPVIQDVAILTRENPGTISLGQGVVHYRPPQQALDAIVEFGHTVGDNHYQAVTGIPELLSGLTRKLAAENDIDVSETQSLVVTAGSNMAFFHTLLAICDPGDEVVIMTPFFFNHEMAIRMASCTPVAVATDDDYQPDLEALEAALSDRTRAVVTVSPNNPAGAVYDRETLTAINKLCGERGLYHISDEAYEYFTYGDETHFSPGSLENSEHTISLFSFSKAYGLASWRVGYMVAPAALWKSLSKSQDTILICPPLISQRAALGALQAGPAYCRPMIDAIGEVRLSCLNHLSQLGTSCRVAPTSGAFYLLVEVDTKLGAMELVERLIREHRVAAIPGSSFGIEDRCLIRLSYGALEPQTAVEGMGRLVEGLKRILE